MSPLKFSRNYYLTPLNRLAAAETTHMRVYVYMPTLLLTLAGTHVVSPPPLHHLTNSKYQ